MEGASSGDNVAIECSTIGQRARGLPDLPDLPDLADLAACRI
jgi:hypothetical protein